MDTSKIIYSINIEDVQNVAKRSFGRKLKKDELKIIEEKIGDHFNWDECIENAIIHNLNLPQKYSNED